MKLPWFFMPGGTGSLRPPVFDSSQNSSSPAGTQIGGGDVAPSRQQCIERAGFDHRAGEDVRADGRTLLDHAHRQFRLELLEPDRKRQPGGAGADGDDVVFHDVAFDFAHARLRVLQVRNSRGLHGARQIGSIGRCR